ncbi:MAG: hypothetical protein LBL56_00575 [Treponema sp.]|jgi:hypothetical protein|nr:hypothetical protein [Treponema sp.]
MQEIWIPELLSSLFMFIFLVRPLFKGLWPLDGIAWFPILALGTAVVIFPAYGFRPECIPLAAVHLLITLMNLNPLLIGAQRHAGFHEQGVLFTVLSIGFLVLSTALALWFAPVLQDPVNPRNLTLQGPGGAGSPVYTLHIFEGGDSPESGEDSPGGRPLIFLVPPEFGRLNAVDRLCAALGRQGFTVISYTSSASGPPGRLFRLWRAFHSGTKSKKANDLGRALETEKKAEIDFVLTYLKENLASLAPGVNGDAVFLAGWGAGGSALAYLCAAPEQNSPGPREGVPGRMAAMTASAAAAAKPAYGALGLVVVEGRFWSSWVPASPPPAAESSNAFFAFLAGVRTWLGRFRPARIEGPGTPPQPAIPTLYLVSDRALDEGGKQQSYAATFAALRNSGAPAILAALEGAGPLDYSDFPVEYPLYTALLPGRGENSGADRGDYPERSAALIARFCRLTAGPPSGPGAEGGTKTGMETATGAGSGSGGAFTGRLRLPGGLYLETRSWNFGDLRLY